MSKLDRKSKESVLFKRESIYNGNFFANTDEIDFFPSSLDSKDITLKRHLQIAASKYEKLCMLEKYETFLSEVAFVPLYLK